MNKKILKASCFAIYVYYELLVVVADVGLLVLLFVVPTLLGFLLKRYLGQIFSEACLVLGIALLGVAYVHRKKIQKKFELIFRAKAEKTIQRVYKKYNSDTT